MERKDHPSDVSDEEWAFVVPYLTLMSKDAPQREHSLREVFNGLRWIVRAGAPWRMMPDDLPPWFTVYQQTQRWITAGVFEGVVHDLRVLLRTAIRAAFVRGDTLVALQPTEVFWPLTEPIRCQSGEGGRGDSRYNCEKIIFPISIEEILLQLEHKFSNVFVEPASEA